MLVKWEILEKNFQIKEADRLAGAGFNQNILNDLKLEWIKPRKGCAMHFHKIEDGRFKGSIEPGHSCKINKEGRTTYLKSTVELTSDTWISLDEGFDVETNERIWGSNHGRFAFKKIESFEEEININWSLNNYLL